MHVHVITCNIIIPKGGLYRTAVTGLESDHVKAKVQCWRVRERTCPPLHN